MRIQANKTNNQRCDLLEVHNPYGLESFTVSTLNAKMQKGVFKKTIVSPTVKGKPVIVTDNTFVIYGQVEDVELIGYFVKDMGSKPIAIIAPSQNSAYIVENNKLVFSNVEETEEYRITIDELVHINISR